MESNCRGIGLAECRGGDREEDLQVYLMTGDDDQVDGPPGPSDLTGCDGNRGCPSWIPHPTTAV